MSDAITFSHLHLSTGVRLHYAERGPQDGPAVIMLHGYTDSWFSFSRVLSRLPSTLRVIVPDQRGHGGSDRPSNGYDLDDFARDVVHMMEALGVPTATLVGHCMGGFVAQRVARLAPERVNRLALVSSAATSHTGAIPGFAEAVESLNDPVSIDFVRDFQMSTIHREVPAEFMDRVVAESLRLPARVWQSVLGGIIRAGWISDAGSIRCPTLVLWGDRDSVFSRADQEELISRVPQALFKVNPEIGHCPHWESPDEFVRDLLAFHSRG